MVGWHHRRNGHEFGSTLGVGNGQGSLACCSPWGLKESEATQLLNNDALRGQTGEELLPCVSLASWL